MIIDNGKHYLYRHIRLDTNQPFYVGIGTKHKEGSSYRKEHDRAYHKDMKTELWKRTANKSGYKVQILLESNDYEFIKEKEKEFILLYGKKINGGLLTNFTDGGDGLLGHHHTEDSKRKMSDFAKMRVVSDEQKERLRNMMSGKKHSKETKLKMSESHKGRIYNEEFRKKMSLIAKKRYENIEEREKASLRTKQYFLNKKINNDE